MFLEFIGHLEKAVVNRELKKKQIKAYLSNKETLINYVLNNELFNNDKIYSGETVPPMNEDIRILWKFKNQKEKYFKAIRINENEYKITILGYNLTFTPNDGELISWNFLNY